jgi:hypothetical protein
MFRESKARVAATTFLAVLFGVLQMSCGSSSKSSTYPPPMTDSKVFTSTVVSGHSHTITIQKSEIETPPTGGISRETSSFYGHTHTFTMTETQLTDAKTGPVVITTSVASGHSHDFTIQKWY